jgi:hypothetical protein
MIAIHWMQRLLAAGGIATLSACATGAGGEYAWQEGWREAEVVSVLAASAMKRPRFYDCVRAASPEQLSSARFAIVNYKEMSRTHRRAVPLAPGSDVSTGDLVYVRVGDCATQPVRRQRVAGAHDFK